MGFKVTNRRGLTALEKLLDIGAAFPQMAATVQAETLGMAVVAARANVYNTVPGAYQRTGDYLRSLGANAQASKTGIRVKVSSDSKYARFIEYGQAGTPQQLQAQALAQTRINSPLTLGRSGQAWWIAGPVLTSAQVYAARRMRDLLVKQVLASWR